MNKDDIDWAPCLELGHSKSRDKEVVAIPDLMQMRIAHLVNEALGRISRICCASRFHL